MTRVNEAPDGRLWSFTLGDVLREKGRSSPARTAAVCGEQRWTFAELDQRVDRLALALDDLGIGSGDRVLWLGQNCHRVLELLLACARLGAVMCAANWRQTPDELAFIVDDLEPSLIFWQEAGLHEVVRRTRALIRHRLQWSCHDVDVPLTGDERPGYEALLARSGLDAGTDRLDGRRVSPDDAVLGIYTSAFAGRPRCALISQASIIAQDLVVAKEHTIDASTVYLNCGPLFHVGTLMSTLATFHMGGTNVFMPRAEAEGICRLVSTERVTRAFIVEPTRQQIVEAAAEHGHDLSSLQGWPGSPQWEAIVTRDESPWGRWVGGYGQTEVMGHATFRSIGAPSLGEHGRPNPGMELRIVDDDLVDRAVGEVGEIVLRGPTVMVGYHASEEENARRQAGGWQRTADLGRREADGSLTFVGPKARMLKSGVENIYPAEVEACINSHPDVAECAVIGVADPTWVQSVKAVVVPRPGAHLTADVIIEHCRNHIASYKKPRIVDFAESLPRTAGIIDYAQVDEQYGGGGYPGGATRALPS